MIPIPVKPTVLFVLGLTETLADLADGKNEPVGLSPEGARMRKRKENYLLRRGAFPTGSYPSIRH